MKNEWWKGKMLNIGYGPGASCSSSTFVCFSNPLALIVFMLESGNHLLKFISFFYYFFPITWYLSLSNLKQIITQLTSHPEILTEA